MSIVRKLPFDILQNIYFDHFFFEQKNNELINILRYDNSKGLNCEDLLNFFDKHIVNDHSFILYLNNNNLLFQKLYQSHFIEDKQTYILLTKEESLCTSWLYALYLEDHFSEDEKEMYVSAYFTINYLDAWSIIRDYGDNIENNFMYASNEKIDYIKYSLNTNYDGHSGSSLALTIRKMIYISKHGLCNI
jgi:hypothetical protein